ncbi:MAG: UvrD-helicase domain-containing protein [Bacilli bacterium]|nr:UvrD-helicase domain-containing protein [Bacilli bacterium]
MNNPTENQLEAITKEGTNIIVSAGAGSGKTTVLTARVIRKIQSGIDINRLLVLTFTNEAALNMKNKIRKELIKNNIEEALDYIDQAYITTFDSYALSIVKKYHYLLNISPNISIIDSSIIDIKRREIIDEIFDNMYGDTKFEDFISKFTVKDDDDIKKFILTINKSLDLKYDKLEYLDNYFDNYYSDSNIEKVIQEYAKLIFNRKEEIIEIINKMAGYDSNYASKLFSSFDNLISSTTYEEIAEAILNSSIPKLPNNSPEELKKLRVTLKKKLDNMTILVEDDLSTLKENVLSTKDYVEVIIKIIKELDKKIALYKQEYDNYEFIDISKMAIKVVKDNPEVRDELKYYYNEIMVDEYQDTNDLQELFVSLIENNNVYMVGDVKQSIYRFRNANPEIFRNKYNNYSNNNGGYKIDLLDNFRSRDEVLKNINNIFDYVMDDKIGNAAYRVSHRMIFGNIFGFKKKKDNQNYNLEILNYEDDSEYSKEEIEAFIIANDIKNKINNHYQILDDGVLRDFTYSDACIIMDRGTAFDTYKKIFEYLGIPLAIYQDEKMNEEKDMYVIRNIINLIIKIHNNELDTEFKYYFTSISRSYLFEYDDSYIFDVFKNNTFKDTSLYQKAYDISVILDEISPDMLVKMIIDKFNIYENTIKIGDINKSIMRINYIISLAKSLSNLGYTPYDLGKHLIDSMDTDIKYSVNNKMGNNVKIMNIHKSKGLEFNVCYFSGYHKEFNTQEIKDSILYSNKYGIITPYYKDGIGQTVLKELHKNDYMLNEISEKIRLLYVGLTRAREKMIIVTSLDNEEHDLGNIVSDNDRLKYNSFLDIINSVKSKLLDYIIDIDYHKTDICSDYDKIKDLNYKKYIENTNDKIVLDNLEVDNSLINDSHFSKTTHKLRDKDEISKMEFGTYMHYLFEVTDFYNPVIDSKYKDKIINFINKLELKDSKIYKEYEFIYKDDLENKHGIIDLMIEYGDHIDIYDYKLKNITDEEYIKQLSGYKKYIENKTKKHVNTYLYSIYDEEIKTIL